ncbi:MAG: Efflux ABC transporter, ATP-binding protein [Cytophagales bacterium]|nr:ABC transporter ATP-binding protein [Bacteroidota bacterium]MBS1980532.1 ABC transporter ATP-binding protein [Bacteroidota bacterium]WHZ07850.1 MAG: Efflux ABC transporter, ATP-binding protein [Cytophagales bacterium]
METVLSTDKLTKYFGKLCAVNRLDLEVKRGQVFGMLGPNGSGKTTTLAMLMGVTNPTSGNFTWFGEPATHHTRKKIGAVLEHPIFYPYLSGQKNLELNALIKGVDPARIGSVLELVELAPRKDDKYRTYSLGMKQRLAIASALVSDPIILILDEPTNGLDPMGIAEIREIIKRIAAEGKTIILASHLLDEVQKVCTHFAVLRKGNLVHSGPVDDVGKGEETVEVIAYHDDLSHILHEFRGSLSVKNENGKFTVHLRENFHAIDLNKFLFEKGIIASHLVTQKKSLEKQFLEILQESQDVSHKM